MKKYQELENKIKELQLEVERLKKQESKLPKQFNRETAISLLEDPTDDKLDCAFQWADTPQGEDYWLELNDDFQFGRNNQLPDSAIIQIQKWIILSYREQLGE